MRSYIAARRKQARLEACEPVGGNVQRSEHYFRALMANASDVTAVLSRQGAFVFVSDNVRTVFGHPPDDLLGRLLADFAHPDDRERVAGRIAERAQAPRGSSGTTTFRLRDGDGGWRTVEAMGCNLLDDPEVQGLVGNIRDVTEPRRIEAELIRAKEAAEAADRTKSAFLATMSHELRTPLNAVIGFAQVIEMRLLGADALDRYTEYAGSIRKSGEHLLGIIEDILDISKIEAGCMGLAEQPVDVAEVIGQALSLLAIQAGQRGVVVSVDLERDLPLLRADALRLRQILVNLLSNAIKFTDVGGQVTVRAARAAGGGLEIVVRDTGVGMAPEDIPKALAAFSQVDQSMTRRYEGTGLGLPLTKRLVELHDGTLRIDSAPGQGATVTITLPAERVTSVEEIMEMGNPSPPGVGKGF